MTAALAAGWDRLTGNISTASRYVPISTNFPRGIADVYQVADTSSLVQWLWSYHIRVAKQPIKVTFR